MTLRALLVCLTFLGPATALALVPERRCTPHPGPVPPQQTMELTWTVDSRSSGCFFFSGPAGLGRDTTLGPAALLTVSAQRGALDFAPGVKFVGARDGAALHLERRATYDFSGPWHTRERIEARVDGNTLTATYVYNECSAATECSGGCEIRAHLVGCGR